MLRKVILNWKKIAWGTKGTYYNRLSNIDASGSANNALTALKKFTDARDKQVAYTGYSSSGSKLC